MILTMIVWGLAGLSVTWLTIPIILRRLAFLNRGECSQFHHAKGAEKSRLGGLAIACAFVILSLIAYLFLPFDEAEGHTGKVIFCSAIGMFALGFLDDVKALGAKKKLLAQIAIAFGAWCGGIQIDLLKNPFTGQIHQLHIWGCGLTILWLIGLPNLINLIDGIDGLAGGISLMLMGLLAYVGMSGASLFPALCAAGMVGAIIGFLRFNFPPARIYMGDGGAYFLGYLVAALSIVNAHKGTIVAGLLAPLFVLALPILDVSLAITRRGLKGLPIFRPDRRHIHHKLLGIGYSPRRAVLTLYFVSLVFLLFGIVVFWSEGRWAPVLFGVGCLAFILSARSFSFSREWFSVGRVIGNSFEMRESLQYALALGRWFEMEAKNCDSVENLWSEFQLILLKLNFCQANLILVDGRREWKRNDALSPLAPLTWDRHEFSLGEPFSVELAVETDAINATLFRHLSEITGEVWHKAVTNWCARHSLELRLSSRAGLNVSRGNTHAGRAYVPLVWDSSTLQSRGPSVAQTVASLHRFVAGSKQSPTLSASQVMPAVLGVSSHELE